MKLFYFGENCGASTKTPKNKSKLIFLLKLSVSIDFMIFLDENNNGIFSRHKGKNKCFKLWPYTIKLWEKNRVDFFKKLKHKLF